MRLRIPLAAAAPIVALLLTSAEAARPREPLGATRGTPVTLAKATQETTAEIMSRERHRRDRDPQAAETEPKKIPIDRRGLPQNPLSPDVASWPPAEPGRAPLEPSPLAPQRLGTSFLGATLDGFNPVLAFPPDSMGAAGPTQYVVAVNNRIVSFTRNGQPDGILNTTTDSFFSSVRQGFRTSDPRIRFDRHSGRWILVIINIVQPNRILLATSDGPSITPSTVWSFNFIPVATTPPQIASTCFADYPTLGVDKDALYIGTNNFCGLPFASFDSTDGYVVRKSALLAGSLVVTAFRGLATGNNPGPVTPQGADNTATTSTEGYFIGADNATFGTLMLRRVSSPGGTPSISANVAIAVPATSRPISVPHLGNQVGTAGYVDGLDDRLINAQVRNGRLFTVHGIAVNSSGTASGFLSRNGVRWYEIQNLGSGTSLLQSGTLFDATSPNDANQRHYFMPSINVSGQGHVAIGCSTGGTNVRLDAATAGRLAGDPAGSLQAPLRFTSSSTSYNPEFDNGSQNGFRRWGDYSYTSVDPLDDMTLWTIQEFCNDTNSYGVQVVKLIAPPPATPASCAPASVTPGTSNVSVVLTGTSTNGAGFFDPGPSFPNRLVVTVGGGGVTVNSVAFTDPTHVTLNLTISPGATPGARVLTVTNPDGQAAASASGILSVTTPPVASTIAATAGTPQQTTVGTPFPTALQATVKDQFGAVLAGVTVTFTAPASGATGTFPAGNTAVTNGAGQAGVAFSANGVTGSYTVSANASPALPAAATFALTNTVGAAATIAATAGTPQSAVAGAPFLTALQVTVRDSFGNPVSGKLVTFSGPGTGPGVSFQGGPTATTNALGQASVSVTANPLVGSYAVTANTTPPLGLAASFALSNISGNPASLTVTGGTPQSTVATTPFPLPLQLVVRDPGGNPVAGAVVTFVAPVTGASVTFPSGPAATTNAGGQASLAVSANTVLGSYAVTANVSPALPNPATFNLTNSSGTAATIQATGGTPQSAPVNASFGAPLQVTVRDSAGNAVSGKTVTFTAPVTGAGGSFLAGSTAVTNAAGQASVTFRANGTAGSYAVTANLNPALPTPATFSLTNTTGTPASLVATGGTPQSVPVNTALAPLQTLVKDVGGNPVSGVVVTFTAPASGASARSGGSPVATAVTSASGAASAGAYVANGTAGSYTISAQVSGVSLPLVFSITNAASGAAVVLGSAPNPSTVGQAVTLTANVTGSAGTPTGTVSFKDGSALLGTSPVNGGIATLGVSSFVAGVHSLTAVYSGDTVYAGLTSAAVTHVSNAVSASTTTLTSSRNPAGVGDSVTLTARVTGGFGVPTGTITFRDGATTLGTRSLSGGSAALVTSSLTLGSHSLTASYGGDGSFAASASAPLTQVINSLAPSTIVLTSTPNPATAGQPVTLTATVAAVSGSTTPTGTVRFQEGTSTLATRTLAGGLATFTTSGFLAGLHTLAAAYDGDATFNPSTSAPFTQVVNGATGCGGADPGALCLLGNRFRVRVSWKNPYDGGSTGVGTATQLTSETGTFWFFASTNVELMVKVLDGRGTNGNFWFLAGALTDVEYHITVTDLSTGAVKVYDNPARNLASFIDVNAFSGGGGKPEPKAATVPLPEAPPLTLAGACLTGGDTLCLNDSRFELKTSWRNPYDGGTTGVGTAAALTTDTGYFWFFSPTNAELVIKVLDGRPVNGKFWVLYGALSDVEYTITVTDTQTGAVKTYYNPPRNLGSLIDTLAF